MRKKNSCILLCMLLQLVLCSTAMAQAGKNGSKESGYFQTEVPEHDVDVIVGRPTFNSATISISAKKSAIGFVKYSTNAQALITAAATDHVYFGQDTAVHLLLKNLQPNQTYFYKLYYAFIEGDVSPKQTPVYTFHTAKTKGHAFSFVIQADSHLDENTSIAMYLQSLQNMAADQPDFLVDLGDTWMTDKYRTNFKDAYKQYLAQRFYFSQLCSNAALFLTLGNHDGESGQMKKQSTMNEMNVWSTSTRKRFYPNPYPNDFYAGNQQQAPQNNYPEDYYAWHWGDVLLIVLDPFRYTLYNKDPWQRTLGKQQYDWLQQTLAKSTATYKFVFIHNLVGGADRNGIARGGVEAAPYFEWGGLDSSGQNMFQQKRPDWDRPIHQLLVQYKVNAVFHGHDHLFAHQNLDGIIYQALPQPGAKRYNNTNSAKEYGYEKGTILNAPGYLKVDVTSKKVTVSFVQTSIGTDKENKQILHQFVMKPR